jgi:hypothetical protein
MRAPPPSSSPAPQRANLKHHRLRQAFAATRPVFHRRHRTRSQSSGTRKPPAPMRLARFATPAPTTEHAENHGGEAERQAVPASRDRPSQACLRGSPCPRTARWRSLGVLEPPGSAAPRTWSSRAASCCTGPCLRQPKPDCVPVATRQRRPTGAPMAASEAGTGFDGVMRGPGREYQLDILHSMAPALHKTAARMGVAAASGNWALGRRCLGDTRAKIAGAGQ